MAAMTIIIIEGNDERKNDVTVVEQATDLWTGREFKCRVAWEAKDRCPCFGFLASTDDDRTGDMAGTEGAW